MLPNVGGLLVSVASLVLGIVGLVLGAILASTVSGALGFIFGIPLALAALTLGIIGRRQAVAKGAPTGMATGGVVLGVIGAIVGACGIAVFVWSIKQAREAAGDTGDPVLNERLKKERIKNSAEFDDVFKKAVEADDTAPAKKPDSAPHKTPGGTTK